MPPHIHVTRAFAVRLVFHSKKAGLDGALRNLKGSWEESQGYSDEFSEF